MASVLQKAHYKLLKVLARMSISAPVKPAAIPLVVCCVFKNEAPYLKEWLDFHIAQGVDRFYLMDNYSDDNYQEVLAPYAKNGRVQLSKTSFKKWSVRHQGQALTAGLEKIKKYEGPHCWVACIDIDEYLFSVDDSSMKQTLQNFSGMRVAAVQVNWLMFGTSNLEKLDPTRPMVEQLTRRAPMEHNENANFKPIAYAANTYCFFEGPHLPMSKGNAKYFFSDGTSCKADKTEQKHNPLRINHYWYRAEEDYYNEKKRKREAYGDFREKELEEWHMKRCNEVEDFEILKKENEAI